MNSLSTAVSKVIILGIISLFTAPLLPVLTVVVEAEVVDGEKKAKLLVMSDTHAAHRDSGAHTRLLEELCNRGARKPLVCMLEDSDYLFERNEKLLQKDAEVPVLHALARLLRKTTVANVVMQAQDARTPSMHQLHDANVRLLSGHKASELLLIESYKEGVGKFFTVEECIADFDAELTRLEVLCDSGAFREATIAYARTLTAQLSKKLLFFKGLVAESGMPSTSRVIDFVDWLGTLDARLLWQIVGLATTISDPQLILDLDKALTENETVVCMVGHMHGFVIDDYLRAIKATQTFHAGKKKDDDFRGYALPVPVVRKVLENYFNAAGDSHKVAECAHCKEIKQVKICSGCKSVSYCSQACQRNHWTEHKPNCKKI